MKKRKIGVDLDDTAWGFMAALIPFHNARYGTNFVWTDYVTFDLFTVWGVSEDEANRRVTEFVESEQHRTIEPLPYAKHSLRKLALVCDPVGITARGHVHAHRAEELIGLHFPDTFSDIHFLGHHGHGGKRSKGEVCVEIEALFMVEDGLHNAHSVAREGIPVFLMDRPWNQGPLPPLITRVRNWREVRVHARRLLQNPR